VREELVGEIKNVFKKQIKRSPDQKIEEEDTRHSKV